MKNKFTILQSVKPVYLVKRTDDETLSTIDKIVTVCAALIYVLTCPSQLYHPKIYVHVHAFYCT